MRGNAFLLLLGETVNLTYSLLRELGFVFQNRMGTLSYFSGESYNRPKLACERGPLCGPLCLPQFLWKEPGASLRAALVSRVQSRSPTGSEPVG